MADLSHKRSIQHIATSKLQFLCSEWIFREPGFLSDLSKKFTRCFKIKMDAPLLQSLYRTDSQVVVFASIQIHHTNHVFPQSVNSRATRPLRHITSPILTPSKYYLFSSPPQLHCAISQQCRTPAVVCRPC